MCFRFIRVVGFDAPEEDRPDLLDIHFERLVWRDLQNVCHRRQMMLPELFDLVSEKFHRENENFLFEEMFHERQM